MAGRTLAAIALLILVGGTAAGALATLNVRDHQSAFEPNIAFVEDAHVAGLTATRVLSTPSAAIQDGDEPAERTLLVLLDVARPYSKQEIHAMHRFLDDGGRILLADGFGHANDLTFPLGFVFERVRVVEPQPNETKAALEGATFKVRWDHSSAILVSPESDATTIAWSTPDSYLDRDGSGTIDVSEPQGEFVTALDVNVGQNGGRMIALADAGPLRAAHDDESDHIAFREALLTALLPDGGRVLVDESRVGTRNPIAVAVAAAAATTTLRPWNYVSATIGAALLLIPLLPGTATAWGAHRFFPDRFHRRSLLRSDSPSPESNARGGSFSWTGRGVTAMSAGGSLLLLGAVFSRPEAVGAGSLLLVALALALIVPRPRVEATRWISSDAPHEGDSVQTDIVLKPRSKWGHSFEALDQMPPEFDLASGSNFFPVDLRGKAQKFSFSFTPAVRGPFELGPLMVRTSDALDLRARDTSVALAAKIRVAPRRESIRRIPFTTTIPATTLGPHLVNRAGDGSEFHSLRDYQTGDSIRMVNWKASARSGDLVVNQRVHESMTHLTVFLDARAVSGAGPTTRTPLAEGCRVVVSVAGGALRMRDRVRFIVYGDGVVEMPEEPGSRQLQQLYEMLSTIKPEGNASLSQAVERVGHGLKPKTPVLVVSGLEGDEGLVGAIRQLRNHGVLPLVVASPIHTHPDGEEPEDNAGALLAARKQTLEGLRTLGIPVFETVPGMPLDEVFRLGGVV